MRKTKNDVQKIIDSIIESGEWRRFIDYSRSQVKSFFKKNFLSITLTRCELERLADEFAFRSV